MNFLLRCCKNIVTEEIIAVGKSAFEMIGGFRKYREALRPMKDNDTDCNDSNVEILHSVV